LSLALGCETDAEESISTWRTVVLDKPFHAGDSKLREMAHHNPQGREFSGAFELPGKISPGVATIVYVNLEIAGVLPMNGAELVKARKEPTQCTRLIINGRQAAILNELAKKGGVNFKSEKMNVRIAGTFLQPGRNEIKVVPGRRSQIDDIEIQSITVSSRSE
jgi:hypothetical protein